eukprot:TRINITY_DN9463_c0_g1_i1.p1 TRINITY_DN9463_c0_g1~~TRINITY_DN9463_c0_g1_i1.p1  ORF type:complete len:490 (-),score=87.96 TRINITY_DN9463_c0_g1_i1:111-1529(-)
METEYDSEEKLPLLDKPIETVHPFPWVPLVFLMLVSIFQSVSSSGQQATLYLYFSEYLQFDRLGQDALATFFVSGFIFITNITTPISGIVSDRLLGNFRTQIISNISWTIGGFFILMTTIPYFVNTLSPNMIFVFALIGLIMFAASNGLGSIQSVLVADQFHPGQERALASSFTYLWFFMNMGSFVGELTGPLLHQNVSYLAMNGLFFGCECMMLLIYLLGSRWYRKVPPARANHQGCIPTKEDGKSVLRVCLIFLPLILFFAMFYQQSSTFIAQATNMSTQVGRFSIPPDIMGSGEDLMVLILLPTFDLLVWRQFERCGRPIRPIARLVMGMLSISLSFVCAGALQIYIDSQPPESVSIGWQIPQYFFMSITEATVCVTGLEFAYSQSPPSVRNTVTALWSITQALGNAVTSGIAAIPVERPDLMFFGYAGGMALVGLLFAIFTRRYEYASIEYARAENETPADLAINKYD